MMRKIQTVDRKKQTNQQALEFRQETPYTDIESIFLRSTLNYET